MPHTQAAAAAWPHDQTRAHQPPPQRTPHCAKPAPPPTPAAVHPRDSRPRNRSVAKPPATHSPPQPRLPDAMHAAKARLAGPPTRSAHVLAHLQARPHPSLAKQVNAPPTTSASSAGASTLHATDRPRHALWISHLFARRCALILLPAPACSRRTRRATPRAFGRHRQGPETHEHLLVQPPATAASHPADEATNQPRRRPPALHSPHTPEHQLDLASPSPSFDAPNAASGSPRAAPWSPRRPARGRLSCRRERAYEYRPLCLDTNRYSGCVSRVCLVLFA